MKSTSIAFSLVIASMVLPACGHKKKSKKDAPAPIVMFNHGDPQKLLAGSTPDKKSFLTTENYKTFDGFHFAGGVMFIEKEKQYNPKDFDEVEDDNSTDDDGAEAELGRYSFTQDGARLVFGPDDAKSGLPSFGFKVNNGVLELHDIEGDELTIEHYSLKKDGKAFSIMGSFSNTVQGRGLIELTFADSSVVNPMTVTTEDKKYNYLLGHNPLKWNSDIHLDLCGAAIPQKQQDSVKASLEAWYADPLRLADEGFRGVNYTVRTQFPPFSDLNSQCVYLINQYKAENSTNFYTAGLTLPAINYGTKEQIDSDVFIFMDHVSRELSQGKASPTTAHEIGHFFGLGHEFDDPEQGHPHYKSIMGYSDGTNLPTADDFKAIRNLYKESLGDQAKLTVAKQ